MSSIGGLSSVQAYNLVTKTSEATNVAKYVKQTPTVANAEKQFDAAVKKLGTDPNALFKNYNLLNFVLTAFGATSQQANIGLLEKVVTSNLSDKKSVANQLNDSTLTQIAQVLQTDGSVNKSLQDPTVQAELKNAFEVASYENNLGQQNPAVVQALDFSHLVGNVKSIYDIMGNSTMRQVVQTVGNIPAQVVNQTLEAQAQAFSKVFDVSKANNPAYIKTFINRFLSTSDINNQSSSSVSSPALSILSGVSSSLSGTPSITSLDIGSLLNFRA